MQSSIKVHFEDTGKGLQPIIAIKLIKDGDDPRDALLSSFFEQLGGQSSWLSVRFDHHIESDHKHSTSYITIAPIRPDELKETVSLIESRFTTGSTGPLNLSPLTKKMKR